MPDPTGTFARRDLTLQEAYDQLYSFFQQSPIPTVFTRVSDRRIIDVNERAVQLIGYERKDLVGKTSAELGVWIVDEQLATAVEQLRDVKEHSSLEIEIRVRSGEVRTLLVSSVMVPYLGEPHILSFCTDITDRKRAEEKIRDLALRLTRAEEDERRRIAQILHDELQQLLYGIQMRMVATKQSGAGLNDQGLSECLPLINEAIEVTRRLTIDLSPPILNQPDLTEALYWLLFQMKEKHGLDTVLAATAPIRVQDPNIRVLLYQIGRELLFNVVKHAGTRKAYLDLYCQGDRFTMCVRDEGTGFDPDRLTGSPSMGLGLFSARERLSLIGGTMSIESTPGKGTRIVLQVKLSPSTGEMK